MAQLAQQVSAFFAQLDPPRAFDLASPIGHQYIERVLAAFTSVMIPNLVHYSTVYPWLIADALQYALKLDASLDTLFGYPSERASFTYLVQSMPSHLIDLWIQDEKQGKSVLNKDGYG